MPSPARARLRRARGKLHLAAFLTATLALSAWLGWQAVDAARSHRRTVEGVLRDYAGIAATELARATSDDLDDFLDQVFDDVPRRVRGDRSQRLVSPTVLAREMDDATWERFRCRCAELQRSAVYFRVDVPGGGGELWPDSRPQALLPELERLAGGAGVLRSGVREVVAAAPAGTVLDGASLVAFRVTRNQDELPVAVYGVAMEHTALTELFGRWYDRVDLLPAAIAAPYPNDSLLSVAVTDPRGEAVFSSPRSYPDEYAALDTLAPELGSLVVKASVRPDAAEHLIIGGLPRSRLPLLSALLLLTLGLGLAALVQVHREHQLARLRDDFVSGVSHEFRTPLTQIRVFAELLSDGKLRTEEERRRSVGVINREARRLTHLVENVLRFSGLRHVEEPGPSEEIDITRVVDEVLEAFGPLAEARRVRLESRVADGCRVRGSRTGLHQMLTNLLDNALKYGPDGQTITVGAVRSNGTVRLTVDDEGPGIPPSERERIWEPYRRLEQDVTGNVRGSGIGLAVVAELAAQQGGRVWVEDSDGAGGRFVVELDGTLAPSAPGAVPAAV